MAENKFLKVHHQNAPEPELSLERGIPSPPAEQVEQLTVPFNSNVSSRDGFSQISELHKCSIHHLCQGKAATATQLVQASLAKASPLYFF